MKKIITHVTLFLLFGLAVASISKAQCSGGFTDSLDVYTLYLSNTATGSYNYIEYDFGDGNWVVNDPNPVHTYATEGIYEVCQFIMDTNTWTCFDYQCDTIYVGNITCQANFYWWNNGLETEFYSYSLGIFDSLSWDFGDGSYSSDTMPMHTYTSPGFYQVCLSLFDTGQMCDSTCYMIYVDSAGCVAEFTYSANGLNVDFTNTSAGFYTVSYWDFGDGMGSSEQTNPSYTYLLPGTYEVCLFIADTLTGSCFDDTCMSITVTTGGGGGCEANFTYTSNELELNCTNTSTGNYATAIWDFGDGSTPSFNPVHVYSTPGTYQVCLTIGNLVPFCADQHCETITVTEYTCEPAFTYSFNPSSNLYTFTNTTTVGNVTAVSWDFGDGNSSTFANPSYTYNAPGSYQVCLTTYDGANSCGELCKDLEVYPLGENELKARQMSIYPNPSSGSFELQTNAYPGLLKLDLYDLSGRLLATDTYQNNRATVNLDYALPNGMYLLGVSDEEGLIQTFRIVIQQ